MILNQSNNKGATNSNKYSDCIKMTIEEAGTYNLNIQEPSSSTKTLCLCFTIDSVEDFTLNLVGNLKHQSVVMNGNEAHLKLHSEGNKWRVAGSRKTTITN